jgi:S-adenosylmethionine:tRNA ribosyltransferase-isomerase
MVADNVYIKDYTYDLPAEKIANFPLKKRDESKLLIYSRGEIKDNIFYHLPEILPQNATLVFNDTRVIEARILFQKPTGGVIEIFCLEPHQESMEMALARKGTATWHCLIGGASKWKHGQLLKKDLIIDNQQVTFSAAYIGKEADDFIIEFAWEPTDIPFIQLLHHAGNIPLPPYIKRKAEEIDSERYQTVFSHYEGSVAAPTAALHFTNEVLDGLRQRNINTEFVTLHVGAGTFKPVKTELVSEHQMHTEAFTVKRKTIEGLLAAETIIPVGTTSLRTLESLHWLGVKLYSGKLNDEWQLGQWEAYELNNQLPFKESYQCILDWMEEKNVNEIHCHTSLLILPGYTFKVANALVTNFHQPQSTLLLLVAAFIGDDWKKIYDHALNKDYRFLSYGDSSLLIPKK